MYDALQMPQELRQSLIQPLSYPTKYQNEMGPPNQVACLETISFLDKDKYVKTWWTIMGPYFSQKPLKINPSLESWWAMG